MGAGDRPLGRGEGPSAGENRRGPRPRLKGGGGLRNTLHLVTARGADLSFSLPAHLTEAGISISRLEKIDPSLEDVFVSLVEGKNRTLL